MRSTELLLRPESSKRRRRLRRPEGLVSFLKQEDVLFLESLVVEVSLSDKGDEQSDSLTDVELVGTTFESANRGLLAHLLLRCL